MIDVVIVDDSALMRSLLTEIVNGEADMRVVGVAGDPIKAREILKRTRADVLTLDIEMPKMNGLVFLEKLMMVQPMPVVMISTHTERGSDLTLRALELGAVDFVPKPSVGVRDGIAALERDIVQKVRVAARARIQRKRFASPFSRVRRIAHASTAPKRSVIAVGASTGGTEALAHLLSTLPPGIPPVVVAQHMPPVFTASFAARLNDLSQLTVVEACDREVLRAGHVYIAPGGRHLRVRRQGSSLMTSVLDDEPIHHHRPSVDALFTSVCEAAGGDAIAVMLTGMGADGSESMLKLHRAGALTIAQDEASSVVFGMPKAAIDLGAVDAVLDIGEIAPAILGALPQ